MRRLFVCAVSCVQVVRGLDTTPWASPYGWRLEVGWDEKSNVFRTQLRRWMIWWIHTAYRGWLSVEFWQVLFAALNRASTTNYGAQLLHYRKERIMALTTAHRLQSLYPGAETYPFFHPWYTINILLALSISFQNEANSLSLQAFLKHIAF